MNGEEIIIANAGEPVAILSPIHKTPAASQLLISRYRVPVRTLSVPFSRICVPKFQKYLSQYLQHNMRDNVHYVANDVLNEAKGNRTYQRP